MSGDTRHGLTWLPTCFASPASRTSTLSSYMITCGPVVTLTTHTTSRSILPSGTRPVTEVAMVARKTCARTVNGTTRSVNTEAGLGTIEARWTLRAHWWEIKFEVNLQVLRFSFKLAQSQGYSMSNFHLQLSQRNDVGILVKYSNLLQQQCK